jgi:hypothetical protein
MTTSLCYTVEIPDKIRMQMNATWSVEVADGWTNVYKDWWSWDKAIQSGTDGNWMWVALLQTLLRKVFRDGMLQDAVDMISKPLQEHHVHTRSSSLANNDQYLWYRQVYMTWTVFDIDMQCYGQSVDIWEGYVEVLILLLCSVLSSLRVMTSVVIRENIVITGI